MRAYLTELLRPWKVVTFLIGTAFFVWGAYFWAVPTWDVGVSLLMSVLCFALAPWSVDLGLHALRARGPHWRRDLAISAAVIYFVASGSYEIYNTIRMGEHPVTYWWNLGFSVPVTIAAGLIWRYRGSSADFLRAARAATTTPR